MNAAQPSASYAAHHADDVFGGDESFAMNILRRSGWTAVSALSVALLVAFSLSLISTVSYSIYSHMDDRLLLSRGALIRSGFGVDSQITFSIDYIGWNGIDWIPETRQIDSINHGYVIPLWPAALAIVVFVLPSWIHAFRRMSLRRLFQRSAIMTIAFFASIVAANFWIDVIVVLDSGMIPTNSNSGNIFHESARLALSGGQIRMELSDSVVSGSKVQLRRVMSPSARFSIADAQELMKLGWPYHARLPFSGVKYNLPLWPLLVVSTLAAILLRSPHVRLQAGHCTSCGYNLTGNLSGRCPECGSPVEPADQTGNTALRNNS